MLWFVHVVTFLATEVTIRRVIMKTIYFAPTVLSLTVLCSCVDMNSPYDSSYGSAAYVDSGCDSYGNCPAYHRVPDRDRKEHHRHDDRRDHDRYWDRDYGRHHGRGDDSIDRGWAHGRYDREDRREGHGRDLDDNRRGDRGDMMQHTPPPARQEPSSPPAPTPSCPFGTVMDSRGCKIIDPKMRRPGGDGYINPCSSGYYYHGGRCVKN